MAIRDELHEAIQATAAADDDLEGSVLVGWVTIAEWAAPDGGRWLSTVAGDPRGEAPPPWTVEGWLHNALHSPVLDDPDESSD